MNLDPLESDLILYEEHDDIAVLIINQPDMHNAFNDDVISALSYHFDRIQRNPGIKALVLKGAGKSFSAGADLNWMKKAADYTPQQNENDALRLADMLHKLDQLPCLTIACVQGAAMGGGMGLVCCCDLVLATEDSKFALSEVKIGLIPATIAPYVLNAIGLRQARRYFQTGERFNGIRAQQIGLAHEVFATTEERDAALDNILEGLKKNGPQAMRASKKLCRDLYGKEINSSIKNDTAYRIARTRAGEEAKEGLSAFLEKRAPNWSAE